ncbi:hypothetical protein HPB51_024590 [Rhipicephalus microplus]|uniref:Uncharacterized protein n=1 Tax=Rhipicephalus microplus TaxID=6941 RepID=A0A9J6EDD1_RHIMP|nr:hypothetical protein HPB51_024590 [Rhipicephalus microplus]
MAENDSLSHVEWKKGVVSGAIYTEHDPKLEGLMVSVYERHLRSNPLHSDVFVGVRKMESEVIRWCCNLFHGGPESCGSPVHTSDIYKLWQQPGQSRGQGCLINLQLGGDKDFVDRGEV